MSDLIPMLGGDRRREVPEDDAPVAETRFVLSMASYNISDGVFRTNEAIITLDGVELGVVRTIRYGADEYVRRCDGYIVHATKSNKCDLR